MVQINTDATSLSNRRVVDYDIHGIVGVRLLNPSAQDIVTVADQLGAGHATLARQPDIVIHFRKNLPIPGLKYLGLDAGFNEDGYYILKSSKTPAKVRIPFDQIGKHCEIICESGLRSVPLLIAIVNLTFLKKNYMPLHASAFLYKEVANVVLGWSKGGKTEALLSFANHGAHYIADEWTIFSENGEQMFGIPEPIRLWDWQFKYIPQIKTKISRQKRILFNTVHFGDRFYKTFGRGRLRKVFPMNLLGEALPALKRQLNVRIHPQDLFEDRFCKIARPDKIFLIMSHDDPAITIEPIEAQEIVQRMISSNEYEQFPFFEHYQAFKFAFPHHQNPFLETLYERQYSLLSRVFEGKEAYRVLHPYPVAFEELFKKMQPYCEKHRKVLQDHHG